MKNTFKAGLLTFVIAASLSACSGNGSTSGGDTTKTDSSVSAGTDTTVKADTSHKDTTTVQADTTHGAAGDTIKKR